MFTIRVPVQSLADKLHIASDELAKAEPEILERVAEEVIKFLEADFKAKSAGGAGANGIRWDRDKKDPAKRIGVVTGQTEGKLTFSRVGTTAVRVLYGTPWARQFDRARTLIPDPLPKDWIEKLQEIAVGIANEVISDIFNGR